ncbi:hypothetical protein [Acidiplasma cupricumulans]|uniref:hypothetical protein n=1 Tax=Acidiplasma cupricumulans TaxID=312540 RepID=UPI00078274EF|nr:hypothetical protein [Acidiplasma cupricumulans]
MHKDERGAAAGINGLFILIGSAMGYAVTGYFITVGKTIYGLIVISAVLIFTGILTTGTIKRMILLLFIQGRDYSKFLWTYLI